VWKQTCQFYLWSDENMECILDLHGIAAKTQLLRTYVEAVMNRLQHSVRLRGLDINSRSSSSWNTY